MTEREALEIVYDLAKTHATTKDRQEAVKIVGQLIEEEYEDLPCGEN